MTTEDRETRLKHNRKQYGLSPDDIRLLKVPVPKKLKANDEVVLTVDQIFHPKSNFSKIEKIHHLENLRNAIQSKLSKIQYIKMKKRMY
jgi:hypothetical protein